MVLYNRYRKGRITIMLDIPDHKESGYSRRKILRGTGTLAGAGALGTLAGCSGQSNNDSGNQSNNDSGSGGDGSSDSSGGSSESLTVSFQSAFAAENQATSEIFAQSMKRFEKQQENVNVDLQKISYADVKNKLSSTVAAGNPPTLAESGSAGLTLFNQGEVPNHGPWIEETEGLPDKWLPVNKTVAQFRGDWWTSGTFGIPANSLGIRPKTFSQIGITDPFSELKTWSNVYDALTRIDEKFPDVIAWEETGSAGDLESYWGEARTAHTGGKDPWIRGDPTNPEVQIGKNPRTDGMMKNCVKLAKRFSSEKAAARTNEAIPALLLTGRVASFPQIQNSFTEWKAINEDLKFGWQDGEGDVMMIPYPKLDPEYGSKIGISELEGIEGEHGGHVWGLENAHTVFKTGDQKQMDMGWELAMFLHKNEGFMLDLVERGDPVIPSFTPLLSVVENTLDLPQPYTQMQEQIEEFGPQYNNTGSPWDVQGTDQIRWTDINETISQSIAGQVDVESLPGNVRQKVLTTLEERNS